MRQYLLNDFQMVLNTIQRHLFQKKGKYFFIILSTKEQLELINFFLGLLIKTYIFPFQKGQKKN